MNCHRFSQFHVSECVEPRRNPEISQRGTDEMHAEAICVNARQSTAPCESCQHENEPEYASKEHLLNRRDAIPKEPDANHHSGE